MNEESQNKISKPVDSSGSTMVIKADWIPSFKLPSSEAPQLQVEVVGGPMDGSRRRINKRIITIGRAKDTDFALPLDLMVSNRHASITREGEQYWLEDLKSSNGTYLSDKQIHGRVLIGPGTIFLVGQTYVEFMPQ